jgi:UDP-N-acetylglucosamine acyltransferase
MTPLTSRGTKASPSRSDKVFIHPSAVVSDEARIGNGCYIGPYAVIGAQVTLGNRVRIESHAVIDGITTIGDETHIYPFVSIGMASQDLKYSGEPTETRIGKRNCIREFVTVHRGTEGGGGLTEIGDNCLLMAQAHVAHDCHVGSNVIMANAATLAGHVTVEEGANIGAYSGVHQFCRVGREAYVGGYSVVVKDALPFGLTVGNHAKCFGLNFTGMKRRKYSKATINSLHRAFHLLLSSKLNTSQAIEAIEAEIKGSEEVNEFVSFIKSSKRGVIKN